MHGDHPKITLIYARRKLGQNSRWAQHATSASKREACAEAARFWEQIVKCIEASLTSS